MNRNWRTSYYARVLQVLLCCWCVLSIQTTLAHDARPVSVAIRETLPGIYQAILRVPPSVQADNQPVLVWPGSCRATNSATSSATNSATNSPSSSAGSSPSNSGLRQCPQDLSGAVFSLDYPLFNPSLASYFNLQRLEGEASSAMLAPTEQFWEVPPAMTRWRIAGDYLQLGIEHIIGGLDHLLFVFGLLVIARTLRRVLWTVTGFTLAHSLTLSLAALGYVQIPIVPVEATIALSIVYLAYEISRGDRAGLTYRYPLIVSFGFGLLHGLGFASALGEIGLVESAAVLSLLFFNLGVELGQLLFIAAVVLLVWVLSRLLRMLHIPVVAPQIMAARHAGKADLLAAYIIGIPATYWLLERIGQFV